MTAIFGWTGVPCPDKEQAKKLLTRMSGAAIEPTKLQITQGENNLIAAYLRYDKLNCCRVADWHVMFSGSPQSSDSKLQQQMQAQGVGQALVDQFTTTGTDFLTTLSGRFVLAMASEDGRQALLAVDRFGVDPLCYAQGEHGLVFASKPIWVARHPAVQGKLAPQSIFNYLYFHMIPSPDTVFEGVSKLEPGCCVVRNRASLDVRRYWSPVFHNEHGTIPKQYGQQFLQRIREGVERTVSDPDSTGCFLSGGTDSSTIAGMLGQVTGQSAKTFSIGFGSQGYDETEYARIAARHFATDHHEYFVTADDVVAAVPKIASAYGEPLGNSSVVPTYYCAKLAREHGVQRLLGGDGGDELFGGNERYSKQMVFGLYEQIPRSLRGGFLEPLLLGRVCKHLPLVRKLSSYVDQARQAMPDRMESYNLLQRLGVDTILKQEFLDHIDRGQPLKSLGRFYAQVNATSMLNRMLATDFKFTLADNDLPKVNVMCDLAGLNVAFPLLDSTLVDLSLGLPDHEKIRRFRLRYFFKQSLKGFLPEAILTKRKHGFGLPFGPWLLEHKALRDMAFDALTEFKSRNIISRTYLDNLMNARLNEHAAYYGTLVWVVMMLEYWLKAHDVRV